LFVWVTGIFAFCAMTTSQLWIAFGTSSERFRNISRQLIASIFLQCIVYLSSLSCLLFIRFRSIFATFFLLVNRLRNLSLYLRNFPPCPDFPTHSSLFRFLHSLLLYPPFASLLLSFDSTPPFAFSYCQSSPIHHPPLLLHPFVISPFVSQSFCLGTLSPVFRRASQRSISTFLYFHY